MTVKGYYGERTANAANAVRRHAFVARQKDRSALAITGATILEVNRERIVLPRENALVFTLSTKDTFDRELYLGSSINPASDRVPEGSCSFLDMREEAALRVNTAINLMQFYLPIQSLNEIAEEARQPHFSGISLASGTIVHDPIIRRLSNALEPCFLKPEEVSHLFIDHISKAFAAHVSYTYGRALAEPRVARGGLAPWQEKRIRDILDANLSVDISLDDLAAECRLSARQLTRAFRSSMGMPPHRWLLIHRVEKAKSRLTRPGISLSEIASACGFADQSHFTRVFTQMVGVSPGVWRRQMGNEYNAAMH